VLYAKSTGWVEVSHRPTECDSDLIGHDLSDHGKVNHASSRRMAAVGLSRMRSMNLAFLRAKLRQLHRAESTHDVCEQAPAQ
jgi:hypothetical protein